MTTTPYEDAKIGFGALLTVAAMAAQRGDFEIATAIAMWGVGYLQFIAKHGLVTEEEALRIPEEVQQGLRDESLQNENGEAILTGADLLAERGL